MAVHLLRWQGPERTERCRKYLSTIADAWVSEWSITPIDNIQVRVETSRKRAYTTWKTAQNGNSSVLLALPDGSAFALGRQLLSLNESCDQSIAIHVGNEAINDLVIRFMKDDKQAKVRVEEVKDPPENKEFTARHGNLEFSFDCILKNAHLHVNAAWCDQFVPIETSKSFPSIIPRESAINKTHLTVQARIELGFLSLEDSLGLEVGEVLLTDARHDAAVQLLCGDKAVATGNLSHQKEMRAIKMQTGFGI